MKRNIKLSIGAKASLVYTIASFITKGVSFITVPIFTRIMPSAEIGLATTFSSWMSIIGVIAALGINTGAYNIAMNEFRDERDQYATSALAITSLASGVIGLIYLIFFHTVNALTGLPWQLMVLMVVGFIVQPATDFWMIRQRYEYKYLLSAVISVGTAVVSSGLAVGAVLVATNTGFTELGSVKVIATYIIYDLVALSLFIYQVIKGRAVVKLKYVKFALQVSLPMMVHSFAKHILDASDKIMIQRFCGNSAVGIYGTLFTLSSLSLIFWNAINASLVPFMFTNLSDSKDGYKKINGVVFPVILIYGVVSLLLALVAPEIVRVIAPPEYYEAIYLMPPVAAGIFFTAVYNIMGNILLYHRQSMRIMFATLGAAVINIVLNFLFIPEYGYVAAAYTTLFANIFLAMCQFLMAKKVHGRMPVNSKMLWIYSMLISVFILLCNVLYKSTILRYAVILSAILILAYKRRFIINTIRRIMLNR